MLTWLDYRSFSKKPFRSDDLVKELDLKLKDMDNGEPAVEDKDGNGQTSHFGVWAVGDLVGPNRNVVSLPRLSLEVFNADESGKGERYCVGEAVGDQDRLPTLGGGREGGGWEELEVLMLGFACQDAVPTMVVFMIPFALHQYPSHLRSSASMVCMLCSAQGLHERISGRSTYSAPMMPDWPAAESSSGRGSFRFGIGNDAKRTRMAAPAEK